jgi:hypothetical protein
MKHSAAEEILLTRSRPREPGLCQPMHLKKIAAIIKEELAHAEKPQLGSLIEIELLQPLCQMTCLDDGH